MEMAPAYQLDEQQQQEHQTHNEPVTIRLRWAKAVRKTPKPDVPYESYHDQQQYHQHHHSSVAVGGRPRSRSPLRSEEGYLGVEGEGEGEVGEGGSTDLADAEADDDVEAGRVMVVQASGLWTLRRLVLAFCTSRRVRESEVSLYHRGVALRIDGPPDATATAMVKVSACVID